jgi:hypothetical protein
VFADVNWSLEALEGAEFSGGSFLSGSEALVPQLRSSEPPGKRWAKPPVFRDVSGLSKELREELIAFGAKFLPKLRVSMRPGAVVPASEKELKLWDELTQADAEGEESVSGDVSVIE